MKNITSPGFNKLKSAFNDNMCNLYFKKNLDKERKYITFLKKIKQEIFNLSSTAVWQESIKYNIQLEATYMIQNTEVSVNRAYKTT